MRGKDERGGRGDDSHVTDGRKHLVDTVNARQQGGRRIASTWATTQQQSLAARHGGAGMGCGIDARDTHLHPRPFWEHGRASRRLLARGIPWEAAKPRRDAATRRR